MIDQSMVLIDSGSTIKIIMTPQRYRMFDVLPSHSNVKCSFRHFYLVLVFSYCVKVMVVSCDNRTGGHLVLIGLIDWQLWAKNDEDLIGVWCLLKFKVREVSEIKNMVCTIYFQFIPAWLTPERSPSIFKTFFDIHIITQIS